MRKRPERLFRFFPPEASDFFTAKKLWLSTLKELNDPFDALPRFDIMLENQKQRGSADNFTSLLEQSLVSPADKPAFIKDMAETSSGFFSLLAQATVEEYRELVGKDYRLVCFSEKLDDLLMWGHYAKGHSGFVIELDPKHHIFSTEEFGQVDYPETDERTDVEDQYQGKEKYWKMLFRKSQHWSYEEEWRFVKLTIFLPPPAERRDNKLKHFLQLPIDSVLAVYFGWQLPSRDLNELVEALKSSEWKDVKKFVMCPDAAKFSLGPISLDEWLNRSKEFEEYKLALDKEIQIRDQFRT